MNSFTGEHQTPGSCFFSEYFLWRALPFSLLLSSSCSAEAGTCLLFRLAFKASLLLLLAILCFSRYNSYLSGEVSFIFSVFGGFTQLISPKNI